MRNDDRSWQRRLERANWVLLAGAATGTGAAAAHYLGGHPPAGHTQRENWSLLLVSSMVLALSATAAVTRPFLRTPGRCWLMSVGAMTIFAVGTVVVWHITATDVNTTTVVGTPVGTVHQSDAHIAKRLPGVPLQKIPTGLYIQSVKFTGPEEVDVSGYVWQRYTDDVPESSRGVVFPEAPDGFDMKQVYETKTTEGRALRGWHFHLTLREKFVYREYPLDKQNVWLRMWTISTFKNEILIPDFSSYPPWQHKALNGLDQDIVSLGWRPYYTAYSYGDHTYSATFGATPYVSGFSAAPDLYFNIGLTRSYAGPLMGRLVQSLFIAAVLFMALFVFTRDDARHPRFGFNTWTAITFAVTVLLVVIVDQAQLREISGDGSVTYLEYFAIAQNLVIVGMFANSILLGTEARAAVLGWRDNLLPALLYWPVLIGLFFAFSLMVLAG
ncbi:hypothetical protein ACQUSR_19490 [Streptomyces sp. P1-3]|uniref:hypothetical protein n=1 Tax=Streptomyces sp. P1-3 TaxID=3421658 RepID=UPI003D36AEEA